MKQILITGSSGYIGSHLCKMLAGRYEIHGLDIVNPIVQISEKESMTIGRVGTLLIAIIGALSAGWLPGIIESLLIIYSIWAPTVLVPFVLGLIIKRPKPHAGWLSIITGGSTSIIWQTILNLPYGIPAILPGLGASLFAYFLAHNLNFLSHDRSSKVKT